MRLDRNYLRKTGFRMPTEAEWEYACRATAVTSRAFGASDELLVHYGWYSGNTGQRSSQPVGRLKPNDWGLFDMYGNVSEWCLSTGVPYPPAGPLGRADVEEREMSPAALLANAWSHLALVRCRQAMPAGPAPYLLSAAEGAIGAGEGNFQVSDGKVLVRRGGSFFGAAIYIRSASRDSRTPGSHAIDMGLRVARTLPQPR
jgi:formylglycine-generating enzyme required for sulfatase activity